MPRICEFCERSENVRAWIQRNIFSAKCANVWSIEFGTKMEEIVSMSSLECPQREIPFSHYSRCNLIIYCVLCPSSLIADWSYAVISSEFQSNMQACYVQRFSTQLQRDCDGMWYNSNAAKNNSKLLLVSIFHESIVVLIERKIDLTIVFFSSSLLLLILGKR